MPSDDPAETSGPLRRNSASTREPLARVDLPKVEHGLTYQLGMLRAEPLEQSVGGRPIETGRENRRLANAGVMICRCIHGGQGSVCRVRETHHNPSCVVRFTHPTNSGPFAPFG